MTFKITKEEVVELLKAGGRFVMDGFGDSLDQVGREAFSQAIEIGIENTIAALYDANVDDKEILRVVSEQWGLPIEEIEDRLMSMKPQRTLTVLSDLPKVAQSLNENVRKQDPLASIISKV